MAAATFASLRAALQGDASLGAKVGGRLRFDLKTAANDNVTWVVDCKANAVETGAAAEALGKADVTVTMKEDDFVALASGKLSGAAAYMSGKMKIKGKVALAQKFAALSAAARKAKPAAAATPTAAAASAVPTPASAAPATSPPPPTGFASNAVFARMASNLAADATLLGKVNGSFCFRVHSGPGGAKATWYVDAKKGGRGEVTPSEPPGGKADCTIAISDEDLVALASGKLGAMSAYMSGRLKLKGKAALAQKLAALLTDAKKPRSKL